MARVYLAESVASGLNKLVVLKVLNQDLASDPEMRDAFIREAEISARLNHSNIVNVYEVFEQGSTAVMVMQHLDGMALSEITSRLNGQIPLKLHLHILCQMLDALHYFHELKAANGDSLGCVHRDVSPHNVMVLHEGGIKVVDFGVAKVRTESEHHTRTGVIKGKVTYMAPEQLLACASVDRRADIYSTGVMLWEAVASRRMWRGMDSMARIRAIVRGEVPSIREVAPGVSDALAKIIERALAQTPEGRFATAEEMQIELEQIAHTEGSSYSVPRELTEFMRVNFGEDRREKQRAIDKAIGEPEHSIPDALWSSGIPILSGIAEKPAVEAANMSAGAVPTANVSIPQMLLRKPLLGVALLAVLLCLVVWVGSSLMSASPQADQGEGAAAPGDPTTLTVQSSPVGAVVHEVKQHVTPASPTRHTPAQDSKAAPERDVGVRSNVEEQELRQTSSRQRRTQARPVAPAPGKSVADATETTTSTAGAVPKAESIADSCNPPYRLDPGGVKVFKPQCF